MGFTIETLAVRHEKAITRLEEATKNVVRTGIELREAKLGEVKKSMNAATEKKKPGRPAKTA